MKSLGRIPRHWHIRRLKYLASCNDEVLPETTDDNYELLYIDIGSVDQFAGITRQEPMRFQFAPSRARRRVRHGDVIISTVRTYLRAVAPIENPRPNLIVSTGFAVVRPRNDLDPQFAAYALRAPYFVDEVVSNSAGVSYPAINSSALMAFPIALPPLEEQRAIAAYLDAETARVDALISKKEHQVRLIREKQAAIVTQLVTRGVAAPPVLKPSGIAWLPAIPATWEKCRVAWLFRERDDRNAPDLPLLEVSINAGVVRREFSEDRIESVAADFSTYKVARKGDVVFNKMRMWQGAVGVAPEDGLVSPDYTVATPTGELTSEYAGYLFKTGMFSAECARWSHGIVWDRLRLYWEGFRDIEVPVPPADEQRKIITRVVEETAALEKLRSAIERSIALLRERRIAMISAAVTGKIDVREEVAA